MPGLMARILSRRANGAPPPASPATGASGDPSTTVSDLVAAEQPTVAAEQPTMVAEAVEASAAESPAAVDAPAGETAATAGAESLAAVDAPADETAAAAESPAGAEVPAGETAATDAPAIHAAPTDTAPTHAAGVPAGAERVPGGTPSFRSRGRLRRRLRYLRRVRELAFRDLGGLVFDLDRFGRERADLVEVKLAGLRSIDGELRALEVALGDIRAVEELEEPGIAACAHCGALRGSDDRFCPSCGRSVDEPVETPAPAAGETGSPGAPAHPPAA